MMHRRDDKAYLDGLAFEAFEDSRSILPANDFPSDAGAARAATFGRRCSVCYCLGERENSNEGGKIQTWPNFTAFWGHLAKFWANAG